MTSRTLIDVKTGLDSPLWRFIVDKVKTEAADLRSAATRYEIQSLPDVLVREQMFMRANAIEDFINSLPSQINEAYKTQLELEKKSHE